MDADEAGDEDEDEDDGSEGEHLTRVPIPHIKTATKAHLTRSLGRLPDAMPIAGPSTIRSTGIERSLFPHLSTRRYSSETSQGQSNHTTHNDESMSAHQDPQVCARLGSQ